MDSPKKTARLAGFLWLMVALFSGFYMGFVRSGLIVYKDPDATANNIMANELFFRLGVASFFIGQVISILVAFALFRLFKEVNRNEARLMLTFLLLHASIGALNSMNQYGALLVLGNADYLQAFEQDERTALMMIFLRLNNTGLGISEIFLGLGLLTLGLLILKSEYIPKIIGVFLMFTCFGFVTNSLTSMIAPTYHFSWLTGMAMALSALGVLSTIFWLLIMGVKTQKPRSS